MDFVLNFWNSGVLSGDSGIEEILWVFFLLKNLLVRSSKCQLELLIFSEKRGLQKIFRDELYGVRMTFILAIDEPAPEYFSRNFF